MPADPPFRYRTALPYEPGVTRRDPSPVIRADGAYHVWYSKATVDPSGYYATVWHATSPDGLAWAEQEEAIATGPEDAWDANGVFTPTILLAEDRYWLFYTAVPKPFDNDNGGPNCTRTAIGAAVADTPNGPWRKLPGNPLLRPSDDPVEFDSLRVDDACFVVRDGQYWLYYKGRQQQHSPQETKMGVAVANTPDGPYVKHADNPLVDGGHEVCCWPCAGGVAGLFCAVGPAGNSLRWSPDGLSFRHVREIVPPAAPGPLREDAFVDGAEPGLRWGLCHDARSSDRPFLLRFDVAPNALDLPT
jgi:beta-xylosidase